MLSGVSEITTHSLDRIRVGDCMHQGIVSCDPSTALHELAALMSSRHVHAVVVQGDHGEFHGIASDLDVTAAVARDGELTAGDVAGTEVLSIPASHSLHDGAQLLAEHGVSHLVVMDDASGKPVGVLSTSDILAAFGRPAGTESS